MRIQYSLNTKQLDKVEASLTLTMPLEDWKHLESQMPQRWPSSELSTAILNCVREVSRQVEGEM